MNYIEITMCLTVLNSIMIVAGGYAIIRRIKKQPRPGTLDELWRNFASKPENRKDLERIIEKHKSEVAIKEDHEVS